MKTKVSVIFAGLIGIAGIAAASDDIDSAQLGLSKTSVFDTPAPSVFDYPDTKARYSEALPRAFFGAPPQVPHEVDSMLPITRDDNSCLECHDRPEEIGVADVSGGRPMDENHYAAKGATGAIDGWRLSGARYNCNQCHVPQAEVTPLVDNTFPAGE